MLFSLALGIDSAKTHDFRYCGLTNSVTGAVVWQNKGGAIAFGVNASPITYAIDNVQYLAFAAGGISLFGYKQVDQIIFIAFARRTQRKNRLSQSTPIIVATPRDTKTATHFLPGNTLAGASLLRRRLAVSRQRNVMSEAICVEADTLPTTARCVKNASHSVAPIFFGGRLS